MSMYTDPTHIQISDPGHLEGNCVFTYLDAFSKPEHFEEYLPEYHNLDELKEHYTRGGLGDVKNQKSRTTSFRKSWLRFVREGQNLRKTFRQYMKF